jgi:GR25 family glycosyltransferase involved in LPS biosynthesis
MHPSIRGVYINLDRAAERRAHMEREVAKFGLADVYSRLPATGADAVARRPAARVLKDGEIATFQSHYRALKLAAGSDKYLHVLEDDAALSPWLGPVLSFYIKTGLTSLYDLIFLNFIVFADPFVLRRLQAAARPAFAKAPSDRQPQDFSLIDVITLYGWGGDSYVINPDSASRLLGLYEAELDKGPKLSIDGFFQREIRAGKIKAGAILPFITTLNVGYTEDSQVPERTTSLAFIRACRLLRSVFFADRDLAQIGAETEEFVATAVPERREPENEIFRKLAGALICADWSDRKRTRP